MATSMRRALMPLHRMRFSNLKNAEALLEVRYPLPFVVPIRTKKRYPRSGDKRKGSSVVKRVATVTMKLIIYVVTITNISLLSTTTAGVFDPYIPPEGDARLSSLSKEGLKQCTEQISYGNTKPSLHCRIRKIKEHDAEFTTKVFPVKAQERTTLSHNGISSLSVHPVQEMVRGNHYKMLRWHFVDKGNMFGQVTVRMHSRQTLAVYDRFGRLMMGSEEEPRDVLEYLVLERHLVNHYGMWRLHGKIEPAWAPVKEPIVKTVMILGPELKPGEEFEGLNYEVPKPKAVQWHK
uniref:Large ribosomal subunit protein mL45 n=1 Tax=Oncorhynchus tshawytscha TaxID=74940 RepID=A0A8C8M575_ONCTS